MQIDFIRYTIIKIIILASLIGMVFKTNTDFPYELVVVFTIIFIIEMLFVWALGEKKIKKVENAESHN